MEVVVIGVGRIGAVAAYCWADAGHRVTGIEIDTNKLKLMNSEVVPYHEPELEGLLKRRIKNNGEALCHCRRSRCRLQVLWSRQEVCLNGRAEEDSRASYNLAYGKIEV
jgi:UDP-glucose 6-dehydrogenase